ncbi:hypothetical protein VOLCADRAFT_99710 [Volvox carteri f. nagariensis]|uniref:Reverse transcriptase domain-containing protein n=1 Tax=Volvox carteri f. nagariensis TaxID=3068 RepID=D8UIF8_VOLCA|nr:uncharacterized protein VOLCADRAFT_99710 [Volvox carteri f. nagariensis]EFJ40503.1 hypothetical protein VOLCADRAFT_99710 [Volvox carteri f. nagariensis]|eukprot:XP_002958427.1 hypothetical protein VOLCADRAFT_99710 [Volvox carteri f. nagariensis]
MQIDFSKVFDSVNHETLWDFLMLWPHRRILDSLKTSYTGVKVRVKLGNRLGPEFTSVSLAGGELTNLLLVDDVSLVATGQDRAECLLGLLKAYCKAMGVAVNAAKCEVLIFWGTTRLQFSACTKQLLAAGRRATLGVSTLCRDKKITTRKVCMPLCNTLVVPVFSHGAQVWGPDFINVSFEGAMANPMVQEQDADMRSVVGVGSTGYPRPIGATVLGLSTIFCNLLPLSLRNGLYQTLQTPSEPRSTDITDKNM